MTTFNSEAKVGLFVLMGIFLLVYMSLKVGGLRLKEGEGYEFTVRFDSVAGLDVDAPVRIAGVEIGRVKEIVLEDFKGLLILRIHPKAIIKKDFTALLKTQGLLGERYVELIPGLSNAPHLEPGGEITRTISYTDPDRLVDQLSNIADDVQVISGAISNVFADAEGETTLKNIFANLDKLTSNLQNMISDNKDNISNITANLADFSRVLKDKGPSIVEKLESLSSGLGQMVEENREDLRISLANLKTASENLKDIMDSIESFTGRIDETADSVGSIARKIDSGEGSIGRLVNEEETIENLNETIIQVKNYIGKIEKFKTFARYKSEFLFETKEAKSFFSLTFQPTPEKYYFLEIVDNPRDRILFEDQGGSEPFSEVSYSAQVARRFDELTVRGGLLESTGGVGLDYSIFDNRINFTFEASDFDKNRNPHLKVAATYGINRYFFITGGYDDFVSRQGLETLFFGMGLRFEDADLRDIIVNLR
ncbi:MAG: MlaD family protein [Thermodesulfobacteriota bacterium]